MATDFLSETRQEITNRLSELKPLVDEYHLLEAAAQALAGVNGSPASGTAVAPRRGPGRPPGSSNRKKAAAAKATTAAPKATAAPTAVGKPGRAAKKPRAGRRKRSSHRAAEALALVQATPGITIPELAAKMGIKQNYLYRVLHGLESEKRIQKKGRAWHPTAAA